MCKEGCVCQNGMQKQTNNLRVLSLTYECASGGERRKADASSHLTPSVCAGVRVCGGVCKVFLKDD